MSTPIPHQPVAYTDEDFATSTERVRAAREQLRTPRPPPPSGPSARRSPSAST
jgi:hypothetical protein